MPTVIRVIISLFVALSLLTAAAYHKDGNTHEMTWALGLAILLAIFAAA